MITQYTEGYVYLMKNKRNKYWKIGHSRNPEYREKTLQAEEPEVILHTFWHGDLKFEALLHHQYREKRLRGEWFKLTKKDVDEIESSMMGYAEGIRWEMEKRNQSFLLESLGHALIQEIHA